MILLGKASFFWAVNYEVNVNHKKIWYFESLYWYRICSNFCLAKLLPAEIVIWTDASDVSLKFGKVQTAVVEFKPREFIVTLCFLYTYASTSMCFVTIQNRTISYFLWLSLLYFILRISSAASKPSKMARTWRRRHFKCHLSSAFSSRKLMNITLCNLFLRTPWYNQLCISKTYVTKKNLK